MDTPPCCLDHRLEKGSRRSLPVGPSDVNDRWQFVLGIAKLCKQPLDPPERQVYELRVQPLHVGQKFVALGHRGSDRRPGSNRNE